MTQVEKNKKAVEEMFKIFEEKPFDSSKLAPFLSPNVTQIRGDTKVIGKEVWLSRLSWVFQHLLPESTFESIGMIAEGNKVWTFAIIRNAPDSIVVDSSVFERETVDMFTFDDQGLLIEHRDVQQNALIERQVI